MADYVFITDTHFTASSNVRVGDYFQDLKDKLSYVVEKANEWNATIIHSGDFFDKPSVADFVKSEVSEILQKAIHKPFVIYGNHDTLFNNPEKNYKTSLNVLITNGVVKLLTKVEFEDHILTSQIPVEELGKPQIVLYHGFLNSSDKYNNLTFADIQTTSPTLVLLGHDHVPYDDVEMGNITYSRIGSFARAIRNDSEQRNPQMLRVRVTKDKIVKKLYPIKCKDFQLIFKEKKQKVENLVDYSDLIEQIRSADTRDLSLMDAVRMVADENTVHYIRSVKDELESLRESK